MCITFFKIYPQSENQNESENKFDSGCPLKFVVGFNRDEDIFRKALPLQYHPIFQNIICGIDVITGTTWLAFNKKTSDIAFLTNYRTMKNDSQQSKLFETRGTLILEYVKANDPSIASNMKKFQSSDDYIQRVFNDYKFKGFNLVFGNLGQNKLNYCQNQNNYDLNSDLKNDILITQMMPNILNGMSNGNINEWDKVDRGKQLMQNVLSQYENSNQFKMKELADEIIQKVMQNSEQSQDDLVQTTTKLPFEYEKMLSSIFVRDNSERDCTVSTIVFILDKDENFFIKEVSYNYDNENGWSKEKEQNGIEIDIQQTGEVEIQGKVNE